MATAWITHEHYFWHDLGSAAAYIPSGGYVEPALHIDNPSAKRRFRNLIEVSGLLNCLSSISPREATNKELRRFHSQEYINKVAQISQTRGGDAGQNALVGPNSFEIARLAVGGCITAVDVVLDGKVKNAYALVRPSGHHAEPGLGIGYCIFGNVVLAIMHAIHIRGIKRVAVIDWDVHHGNGAQLAFWTNPNVLTISIHQDRLFPRDRGLIAEVGEGKGKGYNLNIPLPPGSGTGAYKMAFKKLIRPAIDQFKPELILVACGYDASAIDPLGRMLLYSDGYRFLTQQVMQAAIDHCSGRLVLCQEGGYSTAYLPFCGLATLEELSGVSTGVEDPFLKARCGVFPYQDVQHQQEIIIKRAEANLKLIK